MKSVFAALIILLGFNQITAQHYIPLGDVSGYRPSQTQISSLEAKAVDLGLLLDSMGITEEQFKIFDFGFYLHNEHTTYGYPEPFEQKKAEVDSMVPYYLLFGKQTDNNGVYTKFWVDLVLPDTGVFACLTESKKALMRETVSLEVEERYSNLEKITEQYSEAEIAGIDYLKYKMRLVASGECCSVSSAEIKALLLGKGYKRYPARFIEKPSSTTNNTNQKRTSAYVEDYADLLCEMQGVIGFEDFSQSLGEEIFKALADGVEAKAYITKDVNLCESVGDKILNGFDDDAYIHLHFSPNQDSLVPGALFYKEQPSDYMQNATLPEVDITAPANCDGPFPLPDPIEWSHNPIPYNFAITKEGDTYNGYTHYNNEWYQGDSVEYYNRGVFDPIEAEHTWADRGSSRSPIGGVPFTFSYRPSMSAWMKSEGGLAEVFWPTKDLERLYLQPFLLGSAYYDERLKISQQLKYANFIVPSSHNSGSSLNWDCNSSVSKGLHSFAVVHEEIERVKDIVKHWIIHNTDLNGLFIDRQNFDPPNTDNVDFSTIFPLWSFQAIGGTQGRKIQIKKLTKISDTCFELEIIFTMYDNFGNGQRDGARWYFPGLVELWVLQHYRNYDCDHLPCFIPITNHTVEIVDKSVLCLIN